MSPDRERSPPEPLKYHYCNQDHHEKDKDEQHGPEYLIRGVRGFIVYLGRTLLRVIHPGNFVALVLFLLEVKVTSYGLLTIGGLICFVLGSLMLFESPIPDMRVSLGVILPTAIVLAAVTSFLLSRVLKTHRMRPMTGVEGLVGKIGAVFVDIDPVGKVLVNGE